jgi:flagellar basal body rod protein FlgG
MGDGIYVALSGAARQIETLDTIADNIANASRPAYQRARLRFRAELARAADGSPLGFVDTAGTAIDRTPGAIKQTGRPLDVVLPQDTFLAVTDGARERYTRAASMSVGARGELHVSGGARVLGENGKPIVVDPKGQPPEISTDGQVMQGEKVIGRLKWVSFARPSALLRVGGSLLSSSAAAGPPRPASGTLVVGAVEESNVNVVRELTDLISASRAFEAAQRTIDAFRDADRTAATKLVSGQ